MVLREFGPDDAAAVAAFVEVENAVRTADSPWRHPRTPRGTEMALRHGWDGEPDRAFLVEDGGLPVGTASLGASEWDNLDLAWLDLAVHPDHRRRGLGSHVLVELHAECLRLGRPLVGVDAWDAPGPRGFAAAHGYEEKSRSANRRQPLHELDDVLSAAYEEAVAIAHDYELLRIAGPSPVELHDELARVAESINDAPLDDLEVEDEVYPPERLLAFERAQTGSGRRLYRVVARHRGSGELAGHTVVTVEDERPWIGTQEDTTVVARHRGHRLGLLLKADLARWLREVEPQLRTLDTWNAVSNDHMVGVNERLGYQVVGVALSFQRRLDHAAG
jgi:GNAT superfamily N-acetyltransferase